MLQVPWSYLRALGRPPIQFPIPFQYQQWDYLFSWPGKKKDDKGGGGACRLTCGEGCGGIRPGWTVPGSAAPSGASYLVLIWPVWFKGVFPLQLRQFIGGV